MHEREKTNPRIDHLSLLLAKRRDQLVILDREEVNARASGSVDEQLAQT
jgi:hypothetical protein